MLPKLLPILGPNAPVLFGVSRRKRNSLLGLSPNCAYCGDTFIASVHKPHIKPQPPTYDHIRPKSAKGTSLYPNGILACPPCNNVRRQNIPLLEFIMGDRSKYYYSQDGEMVLQVASHDPPTPEAEIQARKKAFSNYLKRFVKRRYRINTAHSKRWFPLTLDNLLYPVWKKGAKPSDPATLNTLLKERIHQFMSILADADPGFWLSQHFQKIVRHDFRTQPERRDMFLEALRHLRGQPKSHAGHGQPPVMLSLDLKSLPFPKTGSDA